MTTKKLKKIDRITSGIPIPLTTSKSESNRFLIISALAGLPSGGIGLSMDTLAKARDTQTMQKQLMIEAKTPTPFREVDVLDAGTTMRFITSYLTILGRHRRLTGTQRMKERPIGILVDKLIELGANIEYDENIGYPPFTIKGFQDKETEEIKMPGDISSQFISSLLMIAPYLKKGLKITFTTDVGSWPYLDMTLRMMKHFGAKVSDSANGQLRTLKKGEFVKVEPGKYIPKNFLVEADWSAASYWYSIVALSPKGTKMTLNGLKTPPMSIQGDAILAYNHYNENHEGIMRRLGVQTLYDKNSSDNFQPIDLYRTGHESYFEHDFTFCPDIAQTVAVICAAKGIKARLTGLESLRIKETDRIDAIKNELAKFGVEVKVEGDKAIEIDSQTMDFSKKVLINTYKDHRMAMAFAPLALKGEIEIENPDVVNKSYPDFWRDLEFAGFQYS